MENLRKIIQEIIQDTLSERRKKRKSTKKKKDDRCTRIAKRRYDVWPSAYASGAVVKCRQGKIWKGIKEADDLTIKNSYIDKDGDLDFEQIQNDLIKIKSYFKSLLPNYINNKPLTDNQINQLIELFVDNESDIFDAEWMTDADKLKLNQRWRKADIDDLSDWFVSYVEGLSNNWGEFELNENKKFIKQFILEIIQEDESLHKWFKRQGTPGKEGGWVDCNTCRKVDGKTKCKACGRKKGEKRAKYPSCRPTPSACKQPGKGKKWGKTK